MKAVIPLIVLLISGCSTQPQAVGPVSRSNQTGSHEIWVVNHGWHTGVILPRARLEAELPSLGDHFSDLAYLEVGWGEAGFYQAETITPGLIAAAILYPTPSVLHVAGFNKHPREQFAGSEVARLKLSDAGIDNLTRFIGSSFATDAQGKIMPLGKGVYGHSRVYRATGRYHLFRTCNQWTAKALRSGGIDIHAPLALTPERVMAALRGDGAP